MGEMREFKIFYLPLGAETFVHATEGKLCAHPQLRPTVRRHISKIFPLTPASVATHFVDRAARLRMETALLALIMLLSKTESVSAILMLTSLLVLLALRQHAVLAICPVSLVLVLPLRSV